MYQGLSGEIHEKEKRPSLHLGVVAIEKQPCGHHQQQALTLLYIYEVD